MMLRFVSEASGTDKSKWVDIIMDCSVDKDTFTIGRAENSDLCITLPSISREHCKFIFNKSGNWLFVDTSSSGTWINDKRLTKNKQCVVNDKDIIKLSTDFIVYEFNSVPCVGSNHRRPYNSPLKSKDVTDKKPLGNLSSTPDRPNNAKENATLAGYVPESQIRVLAAEDAEKRKKLEQTFAADLQGQKEKYENELNKVNARLQVTEQKELTFKRKYEEWKNEKEFLTYDIEKRKNQLDEVREEYTQQAEADKQKWDLEIARKKEECETLGKVSEDLREKLEAKSEELKLSTEEHRNRVKEKELIAEENKLLLKEKIRLEEEVKRLTEALELSSSEVATLKREKELVSREKETLTTVVDTLESSLAEAQALKDLATENQLHEFEELMESELQCSICTEIILNAQTLICGHTFCQICIDEWREKNPHCPNCRKKVKRTYPSKVVDSFVGKMVDNLTDAFKRKRDQIVHEKEETNAYKRRRLVGPLGEPQAFIDLTATPGGHNL